MNSIIIINNILSNDNSKLNSEPNSNFLQIKPILIVLCNLSMHPCYLWLYALPCINLAWLSFKYFLNFLFVNSKSLSVPKVSGKLIFEKCIFKIDKIVSAFLLSIKYAKAYLEKWSIKFKRFFFYFSHKFQMVVLLYL